MSLSKTLQLEPEFPNYIDFSKKVHRNMTEKVIRFCLYRLKTFEANGHITAHDHDHLRPVFNHHQSEIGRIVFNDILIELRPKLWNPEKEQGEKKMLGIHLNFLTKLISMYSEWKFNQLKKKDKLVVQKTLLDTFHLRGLIRKNFPELAGKILGDQSTPASNLSSYQLLVGIDFTSSAQEKLHTIRSVDVVITYHKELAGKKSFEYTDKTYRLWHDIQWVKRELKTEIFQQHLKFDYDLATAAIRVLYYKVKAIDNDFNEEKYPLVKHYIHNRSQVRWEIAAKFGITYDQAKDVFQYLGNNGQLVNTKYKGLWKITKDYQITDKIVKDEYINAFAKEIERLWKRYVYKNNFNAMFNGTTKFSTSGITGSLQMEHLDDEYVSNQDQFLLYFRVEREILELMKGYMEKKCADIFLEHDGFRSSIELTEEELAEIDRLVLEQTQVEIKLESNQKKETNLPSTPTSNPSSYQLLVGIDFTLFDESPAGQAMKRKYEQMEANKRLAEQELVALL